LDDEDYGDSGDDGSADAASSHGQVYEKMQQEVE